MPSKKRSHLVCGVLLLVGAIVVGCDASRPEFPLPPDADVVEAGALPDARPDAPQRDAAVRDAPPVDSGPTDRVPVRVGLVPVPRSSGDAGSTPANETDAVLDVLAAGSRAVTFVHRWDSLFFEASQPRAELWTRLANVAPVFREQDRSVLFAVAMVDRTLDARPSDVSGPWDSSDTLDAMESLVDTTFGTFGGELGFLSFGTEVDRYLEVLPEAQRPSLVSFLISAMDYARAHPNRPSGTQVGVTLRATSIAQQTMPEVAQLIEASDVAIATYYPLESDFAVRPPAVAGDDLDALTLALAGDGGSRVVVLQEVGYPSAPETGSSEEDQRAFFDGFFQVLLARRADFPFVSVYGLHDAPPTTCAAEAAALGVPGDPIAMAARCSFGMRHGDGVNKPAWDVVLEGIATFAAP